MFFEINFGCHNVFISVTVCIVHTVLLILSLVAARYMLYNCRKRDGQSKFDNSLKTRDQIAMLGAIALLLFTLSNFVFGINHILYQSCIEMIGDSSYNLNDTYNGLHYSFLAYCLSLVVAYKFYVRRTTIVVSNTLWELSKRKHKIFNIVVPIQIVLIIAAQVLCMVADEKIARMVVCLIIVCLFNAKSLCF